MKRLLIAGTASGVGKTTISLGIMRALTNRGVQVSPFKVGPDYIDPGFHTFATKNESHNLDSWLIEENVLKHLFHRNMQGFDVGIIEGVMGLYDGVGTDKSSGSTAQLSKMLKVPVILVLDAAGLSTSAGAIALGYKLYDEDVMIQGIILNNVSGEAHYQMIKEVIERDVNIKCLGYLPKNLSFELKSRHLGLIPSDEVENLNSKLDAIANLVEATVDLEMLMTIADNATSFSLSEVENPVEKMGKIGAGLRIGIAKDKAFSFYYDDNIKALKELGVELVVFSPINDVKLPSDLDALYIGGGFPEVFAKELYENYEFRDHLKRRLEEGLPVYAECGGLMYLSESIETINGDIYEMVDFLEARSKMTKTLQRFGYVDVKFSNGLMIKGHEFHRSVTEEKKDAQQIYEVSKKRNNLITKKWKCGFYKRNCLAAYAHLHFYSNLEVLELFINEIWKHKEAERLS